MTRYKGTANAKAVERDFPHFVDIVVPLGGLGSKLDAMYGCHSVTRLADADLAPAFVNEFTTDEPL